MLIPWKQRDVRVVWAWRHDYWRPWQPEDAAWDCGAWYPLRWLQADLRSPMPYLLRGAWLARRDRHDTPWSVVRSSAQDPTIVPAPDAVIAGVLALREIAKEVWIGRNGHAWLRSRGAYGMLVPRGEVAILDDRGDLRWVVLGSPTPTGCYAMVFDSLELGADLEPHPTGLYRVDEVGSDRLWAALNAVRQGA